MKILKLIISLFFIVVSFSAIAQNNFWTGHGDGTSYSDPNNWSSGTEPTTIDTIVFDNAQVTITNFPVDVNLSAIKIINNSNVTFESSDSIVNITLFGLLIVDSNSSYALKGPKIISINSPLADIAGTIDAGDIHVFNIATVSFSETAEVITANTGGFTASIQGSYSFTNADSFSIYYNADAEQSTGLSGVGMSFGKITVENTYNVIMDTNIQISTLKLNKGNFDIGSYTLTISGNIDYQSGHLAGSSASSLIVTDGNSNGNAFFINFNPAQNILNALTVNRATGGITDIGTDLTIQTQLNIDGGLLRVNGLLDVMSSTINSSPSNYIIFGKTGLLKKQLAAGNSVQIDVGTVTCFAPVTINPFASDNYQISVHDTIYSNGNFGIPLVNRNVHLRWKITSSSNTQFDLTLAWEPTVQAGNFDNTNSYISYYTGTEWDSQSVSAGSTVAGLNTQTRNSNIAEGLFGVFSGINELPTASDNEVILAMNSDYPFNTSDFNYSDTDGDAFVKIQIIEIPSSGVLFIDSNIDNSVDAGETIIAGDQIMVDQIMNQLLKFAPVTDEFGLPYTTFTFSVSDGMNYSTNNYMMTVNVTDNRPPVAKDQTFTIPEHSPNGTIAGKLIATDPNAGQTVSFYPLEDGVVYSDAFSLSADGTVTVNNSDLLEYSINPVFNYSVDACDDGNPLLCTPIRVSIQLSEVIRDLIPSNYISPNGDGHNDCWLVQGLENDIYEVSIFNSGGKLLFHSSDYKNGWDGTSRGRELPPGVYYYLIKSPNFEKKGTITLVR